jgi:hypothetical protein
MPKRTEAIGQMPTKLKDMDPKSPQIEGIPMKNPEILVFPWAIICKQCRVDMV